MTDKLEYDTKSEIDKIKKGVEKLFINDAEHKQRSIQYNEKLDTIINAVTNLPCKKEKREENPIRRIEILEDLKLDKVKDKVNALESSMKIMKGTAAGIIMLLSKLVFWK